MLLAATESYLAWMIQVTERIPVTGLARSRGALHVGLEHVYVGLKVDSSSPTERAAATENLQRELNADTAAQNLGTEEEEQDYRWSLMSDLPVADYLKIPDWLRDAGTPGGGSEGTAAPDAEWLQSHRLGRPEILNVGQLYRHDNATVVLGDPGSGKTTIMRWLALVHARALRAGAEQVTVPRALIDVEDADSTRSFVLGPPLLPILLRVAEYAADRQHRPPGDHPRTLLEFLGHHSWNQRRPVWLRDTAGYRKGAGIPPEILADLFALALRDRRALVVLDGLDEVPAMERVATVDAVTEFIETWVLDGPAASRPDAPSNKVIVTSRIAGYQLAPLPADLTQVTIEGMTDAALQVFVVNWLGEVLAELTRQESGPLDPFGAAEAAAELLSLLAQPDNRYVRDLAANPLLAGAIVSVFLNKGNALPSQRVEVYQSTIDTLVAVWSRRLSGTYGQGESLSLFDALPAVAAHVHETKPNGVIRASEFRDLLLAEVVQREGTDPNRPRARLRETVDSLLRIMAVEVGLLVESGPEAFRFAHQSFQEFLAAQHLVGDPALGATRILKHLGDPRWREPIIMAIGLVNWKHPGRMPALAKDLLARRGPLGDLFPETALLLAAAVPQMTNVSPQIVRQTARHLLISYSTLFRRQRLPGVRDLLESALSTLRTDKHTGEVDAVLVAALAPPADGDPAIPCAAARLIRSLKIANPRLAVALVEAAPHWDRYEFGSPITETLDLMVASTQNRTSAGSPPLDRGWGTGLLSMREILRAEPELVEKIRSDSRWLTLFICLYGGYWNHGAAEALDEYERMTGYLNLDNSARDPFKAFFGRRWGHEDPYHQMAVYIDTSGLGKRFATDPVFTPHAVTRDSPFTWQIAQALRDDDLAGLTRFLRVRLTSDQPAHAAEALLALWALGLATDDDLAGGSPAAELAGRRIATLIPGLRDATVRVPRHSVAALVAAAQELAPDAWERLSNAFTKTLHHAGAKPISLLAFLDALPPEHQRRTLTVEIAQRIRGWGIAPESAATSFTEAITPEKYPVELILAALSSQGTAWNNDYHRYSYRWPSDPLAFPYDGGDDIPLAVLDQLVRLPHGMGVILDWEVANILRPLVKRNPYLRPEVLTTVWSCVPGRQDQRRERTIASLDDEIGRAADPAAYLHGLARDLPDPWYRARALLRIAEAVPDHRSEALREAVAATEAVSDAQQAFQLRERLALFLTGPESAAYRSDCRRLAAAITDPCTSARALLRVARSASGEQIDADVREAVERIRRIGSPTEQLTLLRLARDQFVDRETCLDAVDRLFTETVVSESEAFHVSGRWGASLNLHLSVLAGTEEGRIQAITPLALYARAVELVRAGRQDQAVAAWRALAAAPSAATVQAVLDTRSEPVIACTGPVARSLDRALASARPGVLDPILSLLVRLDNDSEPVVRSWQTAPAERVRQVAALLLAEFGGLTVTTVGPLTELLLTEDDLLQNRALQCITSRGGGPSNSVTRVGATGVEQLARFAMEHSWDLPGAALAVTWFNETLLHDDPRALSSWCDEAERNTDRGSAAARIVKSVEWATDTSWSLLLDRLRDGVPDIQFAILRSLSVMLYRSSTDTGEWTAEDSHLRIDEARWARTHALLRTLDPEPLRGYRWLPAQMEDIVDAAEDALDATGGVLDPLSGSRASTALWQRVGTDFGTIVSTGDETALRTCIYQVGQSNVVQLDNNTRAVQALRARDMKPSRWDWPWTGLLTSWAADLLTTSPQDAPWAWERCSVLEVLAASAEMNPDTFRRRADIESLDRLLTHAALYHNAFPGRAAVGRMLAVRRHGSPRILDALQHMLHDTAPTVRQAALDAIPRLRSVDRSLVDNLVDALTGPSATTAWAAAQLLAAIGQNPTTPATVREQIIAALAEAVQDPKSERTVHFSFVDVAIPQLPELDDVFIDALRKIYRL